MKFKASTHQKIEQRVKEILQPEIKVGETYKFQTMYGLVERPVIAIDGDNLTYRKSDRLCNCSLKAFRRMYAEHGLKDIDTTELLSAAAAE